MTHQIKRYPVQHPVLKNYIRFFWELKTSAVNLDKQLIPQKNINVRFNLDDTPHFLHNGNSFKKLEEVYFMGLQSKFQNVKLKVAGSVHVLGICFKPYGLYPFFKTPLLEFKNQILSVDEIGVKKLPEVSEKLKSVSNTKQRLAILENELLKMLDWSSEIPDYIPQILSICTDTNVSFHQIGSTYNIGLRQMERLFLKYVGLSASTYHTLTRFHNSLNQLLYTSYSKLSDLAYDNDYFDQAHFIREFKRYTGSTPYNFIKRNDSILQLGKLD